MGVIQPRFLWRIMWLGVCIMGMMSAACLAEEVRVSDIQVISEADGTDKILFLLKPFSDPKVFSIEEGNPRIVIDISNVRSWDGRPTLAVNGHCIRQVRTHLHRAEKRLRIVLDLVPSRDYTASPVYYEGKGIYCITVSAG